MSVIDKFMPMLMDKEEEGCVTPILTHGETTFIYIKHNNLFRILYEEVTSKILKHFDIEIFW